MVWSEDEKENKGSWLVRNPHSPFVTVVDFIADMAYIVSFFNVLYIVGSKMVFLYLVRPIELVIDFILFFDMILRFFTAFENENGYVKDLRTIAVKYLSNRFVFDFLAIVPGLVTFELVPMLYPLKLFRYLQLPRFFEQFHNLMRSLTKWCKIVDRHTVANFVKIIKAMVIMLLNIHFFVCFWVLVTDDKDDWEESLNVYVNGIYFITTTFTSIGYGDFLPKKNAEILYIIFLELIGLALFSYFRSSIGNFSIK